MGTIRYTLDGSYPPFGVVVRRDNIGGTIVRSEVKETTGNFSLNNISAGNYVVIVYDVVGGITTSEPINVPAATTTTTTTTTAAPTTTTTTTTTAAPTTTTTTTTTAAPTTTTTTTTTTTVAPSFISISATLLTQSSLSSWDVFVEADTSNPQRRRISLSNATNNPDIFQPTITALNPNGQVIIHVTKKDNGNEATTRGDISVFRNNTLLDSEAYRAGDTIIELLVSDRTGYSNGDQLVIQIEE